MTPVCLFQNKPEFVFWCCFEHRQVDGDVSYSYAELEQECRTVATGLRLKFGFGPGHVAAFFSDNNIELAFALFGATFAGGALSFIKTSLTDGEYTMIDNPNV
ncbi:hypothetical protein HPB48_014421 [Haemaphysalis longicornis]|uniref:AMP-dependent synthetase/ligase domain-containing protein n=1 Tax=Haemaphysalis longicornis TaxID=44386 RepID=A0A9J6GUL9_HAELO|nr:hypothetical protein HPB48_014421 [Haemaphysalis longicornis]